jgi:tetratricopeptide (TPR) repeat protein
MDRAFLHGRLASELGDLGTALGSFRRSLAIADRIGDATGRAVLLGPLADVLQSLGRDGDAQGFIAEIQRGAQDGGQGADVCVHVDALTNAGWLLRDSDPPSAQQLVDQAAAFAAARCPLRLPIALVNQGWLLASAGRFGEARAVLDRFAKGMRAPDARVKTWALRLEAEIILGEDPARAEQHARHLAERATELCSTELLYEAQLLRARALIVLERPEQAAAAFAAAEQALTLWSRLVPLGEGRTTFFQRHDQLALTAIPFFLQQVKRGKPGAKLALAATLRHSIARFVTSLAQGGSARVRAERGDAGRDHTSKQFEQTLDRWPMNADAKVHPDAVAGVCETRDAKARAQDEPALTEPPSQAALFVHPSRQGLLALAWRGSSIDFQEIPRAGAHEQSDELSARIARAAAPMLAGATLVHLYVHRSLAALPLDRSLAPLLGVPIAFAVDARFRAPGTSCLGPRHALLVTNPQHNLWGASESAPIIQGALERMGFRVDRLDGAAATRSAIEARLAEPCTALFQYDGHGISAAKRGTSAAEAGGAPQDRTDDALLLTGGDTLTAADVLDLPHVPQAVVLNGCTTAAPEGLGLAQAFLLAGGGQVIASLDEIPAEDAARFTKKLYETAPSSADVNLVNLFSQAMSGRDIPVLRVFER